MIVKARFFSRQAEEKIKAVGGACVFARIILEVSLRAQGKYMKTFEKEKKVEKLQDKIDLKFDKAYEKLVKKEKECRLAVKPK